MDKSIDWDAFVRPLDYTSTHVKTNSLLAWTSYQRLPTGLSFKCVTALAEEAEFRLDVIFPDVLRCRMNATGVRDLSSEMLVHDSWDPPAFTVTDDDKHVVLETEQLRVVIARKPWQLQVFRKDEPEVPSFFSQRIDDRAYGPGYEVPPIGFEYDDQGRIVVRETIGVAPGEAFYGFGEKFTPLNKWGQEFKFWAVDSGNVSSYRAYKNIPFFMSTAGYGLFVHSSAPMVFRMGSESAISYSFHILDDQLDYFLIHAPSFRKIIERYTDLTGRAPVPPKWSFGFWISRCMYKSRKEVEDVIRGMRARGFPCDVLSIDPYWMGAGPWCTYQFDPEVFPEPEEMLANLRAQGVRTCLWINPYVPEGSPVYEAAKAGGYLIRNLEGDPASVVEMFTGTALAAVDMTNPAAREWFRSQLQPLLDMGVATFKTDFAEQAPIDAIYNDGRTGVEMHNLYPLLYNGTVFELTKEKFGRGLVWGRSGYAGSQRYPVQWGGDSYASFDQMASQLRGLLSYGMSGVPFCSHDVGGFDYPPKAFDQPDLDAYPHDTAVYIRWLQFGVFSSHLRAHGKQPREPWEYGEEAEEIALRYLNLRYRLLPYIYTEAVASSLTGLPMVKPLVLDYQDDPNTEQIDLQYLFGSAFLVAPVFSENQPRRVYLPAGDWVDFWTKESINGGRWLEVAASLETLPVWVKAGTILPLGPEMDFVDQKPLDPLTLELYAPGESGELIVREESGLDIPVRLTRHRPNTAGRIWACTWSH